MKVYNASQGGAFRLFIAENKTDVQIIDYETSLTDLEKIFISKYAAKYGFRNNLVTSEDMKTENTYEWYDVNDYLLNYVKMMQNKYIKDINGSYISVQDLGRAKYATDFIRDKINFYNIIKNINSSYLLPDRHIEKLIQFNYEYPYIIKSVQGKGGKGNIVCFSEKDSEQVYSIISSELFAIKQENKNYDINKDVIVEKFFPDSPSYNLSFYCSKDGVLKDINISQQIIDEVFYRGNLYPSNLSPDKQKDIKSIGTQICNYIHKNYGFIGWIGIDFIVVEDKIYVLEANPRVNSVTHAYKLAQGNAFVIKLLRHKHKSVESIFNNFFFDKSTGILPYQIPNNEEVLIISIHPLLEQATEQLEKFKKQNFLEDVIQDRIEPYSKSISYYIAKMR